MRLKIILSTVLSLFLSVLLAFPVSAQVTLDDVLKRIEALEAENAALKAEVTAMKEKQAAQETKIASVQAAPLASTAATTGNFLKTKMDIELYGFLALAATYSDSASATSSTANGSVAATNAPRETLGTEQNHNTFNASAQDTRLGLNFKAPDLEDGGKLSGKFEMDFAANNGPVYQPRLRHAYGQLDYSKWGVTAGQTWDFFAPINPNTLNSGILWRSGNFGSRHPMLYVTNKWGDVLGGKLTTKIGVLDSDDPYQENSAAPVLGAYSSFETKVLGKPTTIGVGGIYGTNSTSIFGTKGSNTNNIYATTVGVTLKLADWLAFKSEGFTGAKLDDFYGGSSTGITTTTLSSSKPVRVMGGFAELTCNPTKKVETNLGIGYDGANGDQNISGATERAAIWKTNRTYYSNLKYNLSKDLMIGVEYQYFTTHYLDDVKGDDNRVQTLILYKF
jgi:hypothetical protein